MDSKLTLKMNKEVIESAKKFAKTNGTSLSKMIESYLKLIVKDDDNKPTSNLIESLSGVIREEKLASKNDYINYLNKKYQ